MIESQSTPNFPAEVVTKILAYADLNAPKLVQVHAISRSWYEGASADSLWRRFSPTALRGGTQLCDAFVSRRLKSSTMVNESLRATYKLDGDSAAEYASD